MFTTNNTLPHGLIVTRDLYKTHTKTVLRWLQSTATGQAGAPEGHTSLSGLAQLASKVVSSGIQIPNDIAFAFREAISNRKQVSTWFENATSAADFTATAGSNESHRHFTQTLQTIYDGLIRNGIAPVQKNPTIGKKAAKRAKKASARGPVPAPAPDSNQLSPRDTLKENLSIVLPASLRDDTPCDTKDKRLARRVSLLSPDDVEDDDQLLKDDLLFHLIDVFLKFQVGILHCSLGVQDHQDRGILESC